MLKIVIGTELYLSNKFSPIWVRALERIPRKTDTYEIASIAIFDNNPLGNIIEYENIFDYDEYIFANPSPTNIGVSIEQLGFFMHAHNADAMIHIDIDLLPEQRHIEQAVKELKKPISGFTNLGGTHFFGLNKGSVPEYMTAQRIPISAATGKSWWTQNCKGHLFDNMQYWFHYLHTTGYPVNVVNWDVIHAGGASYGQPGSMRTAEVDAIGMKEWQLKSHEDYFNNEKVKQFI